MRYTLETERETDGRWIAEITELPGVAAYGETQDAAIAAVEALAFRVLADRLDHGEMQSVPSVSFAAAE